MHAQCLNPGHGRIGPDLRMGRGSRDAQPLAYRRGALVKHLAAWQEKRAAAMAVQDNERCGSTSRAKTVFERVDHLLEGRQVPSHGPQKCALASQTCHGGSRVAAHRSEATNQGELISDTLSCVTDLCVASVDLRSHPFCQWVNLARHAEARGPNHPSAVRGCDTGEVCRPDRVSSILAMWSVRGHWVAELWRRKAVYTILFTLALAWRSKSAHGKC